MSRAKPKKTVEQAGRGGWTALIVSFLASLLYFILFYRLSFRPDSVSLLTGSLLVFFLVYRVAGYLQKGEVVSLTFSLKKGGEAGLHSMVYLIILLAVLAEGLAGVKPNCESGYTPDYVKRECCLDDNGNGMCDVDEPTTTTTTTSSSTTTTSTTSSTSSTSTSEATTTTLDYKKIGALEECDSIQSEKASWWCYKDAGIEFKDPAICDKIEDKNHVTADMCYLSVATALNDYKLCTQLVLPSSRDDCYRDIGIALNNNTFCSAIRHYSDRNLCYKSIAMALNRSDLCRLITLESELQSDKDECYLHVGVALNDSNSCERIVRRAFRDECYLNVATALKNVSMCGGIDGRDTEKACREKLTYELNASI